MATVNIAFGTADVLQGPRSLAVLAVRETEKIVPSGASQQTTTVAGNGYNGGEYVRVTSDTAVYLAVGTDPTAITGGTGGDSILLLANGVIDLAVPNGHKIAVINATL